MFTVRLRSVRGHGTPRRNGWRKRPQHCRLLFCNETCCMYRVNKHLQFWYAKRAIHHIVSFFVSDQTPHNFVSVIIECIHATRQCSSVAGNTLIHKLFSDGCRQHWMILVGLLTEQFYSLSILITELFSATILNPPYYHQKWI